MLDRYVCWIFRPSFDCTLNGVTSAERGYSTAILFRDADNPDAKAAVERGDMAVLVLDARSIQIGRNKVERIRAVPFGETRWTMTGGNFVWSTDGRFRSEVCEYPIPVHDRIEE